MAPPPPAPRAWPSSTAGPPHVPGAAGSVTSSRSRGGRLGVGVGPGIRRPLRRGLASAGADDARTVRPGAARAIPRRRRGADTTADTPADDGAPSTCTAPRNAAAAHARGHLPPTRRACQAVRRGRRACSTRPRQRRCVRTRAKSVTPSAHSRHGHQTGRGRPAAATTVCPVEGRRTWRAGATPLPRPPPGPPMATVAATAGRQRRRPQRVSVTSAAAAALPRDRPRPDRRLFLVDLTWVGTRLDERVGCHV